jgi:glycosyltransferase involved in cell wall biosynthesis
MTGTAPLVSCVIPVWNAEAFLREAIESVIGQTHQHWELLLVDDGSTDSSPSIIREAVARDPGRVRCLQHPGGVRRGVTATRNLGIREACGDLVGFLDADDVWLPTKLRDQVELLQAHDRAAMVYGRTTIWHEWDRGPGRTGSDRTTELRVAANRVVEPPGLVRPLIEHDDAICVNSVLVRRDVLAAVGGFDKAFPDFYEDFVLWMKIAVTWPVYVSDRTWDRYRQHPGNASATAAREGWFHGDRPNPATATYLRWVAFHLSKEGVVDRRIWRALERRLRAYRHPVLATQWRRVATPVRMAVKRPVRRVVGPGVWDVLRRSRRRG